MLQIQTDDSHTRLPNAFRALRHRNFQLFFAGQFVSLVGTWMQSVAQSWLVYRLTGSVILLGLIGFASQIPVFLIAPFGGAIADQRNRKRVLVFTQTAMMILAFALAALTLTNFIKEWHLFVLAVLLGIANAFDIPTRQAFVVDMVGKNDLLNAIALNSSMFNGARIIGPAVAGILVAAVGEGWCFFLNAVSYIAVLAGLLLMDVEVHTRPSRGSTLSNIAEGFSFVARTMPVRSLLLLLGLVSLMAMPYATLMPIFADKILGGGSSTLGFLMTASGAGALCAALTLATRKTIRGLGSWVALASACLGAFLILFAYASSYTQSFWLAAILLVPVGFCMMIEMSASNTLIQSLVPDELRGRVMAVYSMMFMGMAPLGALMAGTLANYLGAPNTVAFGGAACIIGAALFGLRLPRLREEGRRIIIALHQAGGEPPNPVADEGSSALAPKKA
jgi:MFS family permease